MCESIKANEIRSDLYNIQDILNSMVFLVDEKKKINRVITYLPELKRAVTELENHCKQK